jgi:hypothetical protein
MPPATPTPRTLHPSLVKIEQVRIEQRTEQILDHDKQSNPVCESISTKQKQVGQPHRVQHDDPGNAPLDCYVECLIVRISRDVGSKSSVCTEN